ncbi:cytochrome P450 72A397-like [Zingiber officinale]|uniref:cytochrome P450 72A397-like n=1 Tax=Zingiber officinale TaxID=94328 RepID=UPI001C4C4B6C|nr:cytochrome P450 72A397-like [Zingiber officinale]
MVYLLLSAWSLLLVLFFSSAKAMHSLWWKPKSLERQLRRQGINGNPYRFLYGDMGDDQKARAVALSKPIDLTHRIVYRASPFFHQLLQKYGKRSMSWFGTTPAVTIYDTKMVAEVLIDRAHQFQKPSLNPHEKLLAMGVSALEGEEWANRRKIINPAFHIEKLKSMVPAFQKSCIDMVERWRNMTSEQGSCEVDVWDQLQNLTGDVISRTAFGSNYKEGKKIFELQKEQILLVMEAARIPYIPGFRFVPTSSNKRRMLIDNEIRSLLKDMINKKTDAISKGEASTGDDLLGLLVQYSNDESRGDHSITIDDVIEECKLFYFAGQETTSVLLTWTLILLSIHPEWQQRAREEVLSVCGKELPDFESISHLKLVTMIVYEVLRLYPPVTGLVRRTIKTAKIGDHLSLPAGVEVFLPTIFIHHDREIWGEDVEEFKPERFSEGIAKASKVPNAFLPFGWGPRICLGQNFAMIEAKIVLARILQQFCVELSPSYAHAPHTVITLQPQFGAQLILHQL